MTRRTTAALVSAAALACLPGCGGADEPGDDGGSRLAPRPAERAGEDFAVNAPSRRERAIDEAQRTVSGVVGALNRRDPAACDAFTTRFLEALARTRGPGAVDVCRTAVRRQDGPRQELIAFRRARFRRDVVSLTVEVKAGPETHVRNIRLVPGHGGRWLIDLRR